MRRGLRGGSRSLGHLRRARRQQCDQYPDNAQYRRSVSHLYAASFRAGPDR